jgi:2-polyprenyl-3-methyl-5-hydroxy-6-metoxy-1,4-benzoquinol methylase
MARLPSGTMHAQPNPTVPPKAISRTAFSGQASGISQHAKIWAELKGSGRVGLVADSYRGLAADYDWIFDDQTLVSGSAINTPGAARLLQRIDPGSTVLDAACGTGIDAAALARRGFNVHATDGSQAMVEFAAARFARAGLAIPVQCCLWADLPATISERFDVVFCTGNALVHAAGQDAMVEALTGLRQMARPGGHVVIDSRNWEKLHAERQIVQVKDRVRTREGKRCIVLYAWEMPAGFDQEHIAHITILHEEEDDLIDPHEYQVSFRPFTIGELRERLEIAGLREVDTDYDQTADWYNVVAVPA